MRSRRLLPQSGWLVLALVVGFAVVWPISQLEIRAFGNGAEAFHRMAALPAFWTVVETTVALAIGSSVLAVVFGTLIAWAVSMLPRPVRAAGQLLPLLPLLIPAVAGIVGWSFLLSPRVGYINVALRQLPLLDRLNDGPFDIYSTTWIVIVTAFQLSSFVYLFVHTGLQNMGQEMGDAGAVCGASPIKRLLTITLPLLKPSIVYSAGVVFLLGMGQLTAPLLLGRTRSIDVLSTEIFKLTLIYPIDYPLGAALGFPILAAGLLLVLWQKAQLGEQRRFVVVAARTRNETRETSWWAAAAVGFYALVTTILPLLALIYVSLSPFWTGRITFSNLTLRHYGIVFSNPSLLDAIWTSLWVSTVAVLVVLALGFACASALLRASSASSPIRVVIDVLVTLPLAIPATLIGFGFLYAYSGPPFPLYGTTAVIILTYATLMIGHATRLQFATLVAIGGEFREAAATCGASPWRALAGITLPMARRGMAATAALTFVLMFHEFSASLMVRSAKTQVIGSIMYDIWEGGSYAQVAILALVMVAVTLVGTALSAWIGGAAVLRSH